MEILFIRNNVFSETRAIFSKIEPVLFIVLLIFSFKLRILHLGRR